MDYSLVRFLVTGVYECEHTDLSGITQLNVFVMQNIIYANIIC